MKWREGFAFSRLPKNYFAETALFENTNMAAIRELTKKLTGCPPEDSMIRIQYIDKDKVQVSEWKHKDLITIPAHNHNNREWLIVISGKIKVIKENSEQVFGRDEIAFIKIGELHSVEILEKDTDFVAVRVGW